MNATTARSRAIAAENDQIDASQSRALAAREAESRPRNALEAMAQRLHVTPDVLRGTLQKTAFSTCRTNEEFVSMVIVANEYGLNPMLKEIYAFPAKGGGVVPMVGVDGWIRLMNEHPAFDGIEFDYITDQKGGIEAIEAVVWRKDRSHPIKVIEYLEECRRATEPWKQTPRRMLRHRALIQCVRIAFGFSGIAGEGDEDEFVSGPIHDVTPARLPDNRTLAQQLDDEIPSHDKETGEIVEEEQQTDSRGMTEVSEEEARALDAQQSGDGWTPEAEETLKAIDGPLEQGDPGPQPEGEQQSDQGEGDQEPLWKAQCTAIYNRLRDAKTAKEVAAAEKDWVNKVLNGVPDDEQDGKNAIGHIEGAIRDAKQRVKEG